jgi:hypothetical protein
MDGNANINIDEDSCGKQIMYYRARILHEPRFRIFGRLANEYIVDMFSRNLETRLAYIRSNQNRLRELDAELMDEPYVPDSQNVYLPASFMGSRRWASEQISDSLAVAAAFGPPTFFCTMTCNGQWPAIQSQLRRGQDYSDLPVVVARVFKRAVTILEQSFNTMFLNPGRPLYIIHSVEFQKRGLPHVHILVKYNHECTHPDDIDSVVSAEIPENAEDQELVRSHMIHRHPPDDRPPSKYCQRVDEFGHRTCRFGYPQPLQPRTTVDSSGRIRYHRQKPEDQWSFHITFLYYGNSDAILTWRLLTPLICFNICSNTFTKVRSSFITFWHADLIFTQMFQQFLITRITEFKAMPMNLLTKLMTIGKHAICLPWKQRGRSWALI